MARGANKQAIKQKEARRTKPVSPSKEKRKKRRRSRSPKRRSLVASITHTCMHIYIYIYIASNSVTHISCFVSFWCVFWRFFHRRQSSPGPDPKKYKTSRPAVPLPFHDPVDHMDMDSSQGQHAKQILGVLQDVIKPKVISFALQSVASQHTNSVKSARNDKNAKAVSQPLVKQFLRTSRDLTVAQLHKYVSVKLGLEKNVSVTILVQHRPSSSELRPVPSHLSLDAVEAFLWRRHHALELKYQLSSDPKL